MPDRAVVAIRLTGEQKRQLGHALDALTQSLWWRLNRDEHRVLAVVRYQLNDDDVPDWAFREWMGVEVDA